MNIYIKKNDMNKIIKIGMIVVLALGFTSCYSDFHEPAPTKYWTAEDFAGSQQLTIKEFKQLFYDKYGTGSSS